MLTPDASHTDILWECVKKNNCFMKKFNGVTLSKEPMNLMRIHSKKYSGLLNRGVGFALEESKVRVMINQGRPNKPKINTRKMRVGVSASNHKVIKALVENNRADLIPDFTKAVVQLRTVDV